MFEKVKLLNNDKIKEEQSEVEMKYHELVKRDEKDPTQDEIRKSSYNNKNTQDFLFGGENLFSTPTLMGDERKILDLI